MKAKLVLVSLLAALALLVPLAATAHSSGVYQTCQHAMISVVNRGLYPSGAGPRSCIGRTDSTGHGSFYSNGNYYFRMFLIRGWNDGGGQYWERCFHADDLGGVVYSGCIYT